MSTSPSIVPKATLVVDFLGRAYVAVNPGYSAPPPLYRRVLAWRILLAVLAFAVFVLCVVGQVVESVLVSRGRGKHSFSIWKETVTGYDNSTSSERLNKQNMQAVAVLAALLSFAAAALATAFAVQWALFERRRRREERLNRRVMAAFGHRRLDLSLSDVENDVFPFTNVCVENRGQVACVPCEERETRMRQWDKNFTIATLLLLSLAGVFAVTTLGLLASDYADQVRAAESTAPHCGSGIPLFGVATALSLLGIVLVSVPQLTQAHMCGTLRPQRCTLMVVDEADAGEIGVELRRLMAGGNPLLPSVLNGVPVALPGPAMDTVVSHRHHSSSSGTTPGQLQAQMSMSHSGTAVQPTAFSNVTPLGAEGGVPLGRQQGYCSADYYQPPPQLFKVHPADPLESTTETTAEQTVGLARREGEAPVDARRQRQSDSERDGAVFAGQDGGHDHEGEGRVQGDASVPASASPSPPSPFSSSDGARGAQDGEGAEMTVVDGMGTSCADLSNAKWLADQPLPSPQDS